MADGRRSWDFDIDAAFFRDMESAEVTDADVKVHLDIVKRGDLYDLTFLCRGDLQIPCDRCLDPISHEVDTQYHTVVKYGEEYNDESDDLLILPQSSVVLNVADMIHDTLVLTIPLRHVHPDGECNREMTAALNRHSSGIADTEDDGETENEPHGAEAEQDQD